MSALCTFHWRLGVSSRSKVTNNVDDEEDSTLGRLHRQVRPASISINRMISSSLDQKVEDSTWRAKSAAGSICGECEDQDNDQKHEGVYPVSEEGSFDSSKHGVHHNSEREKETCCWSWHPSQGGDDSRASGEKHSSDQDVSHQAKHNEDDVSHGAITGLDDFEEGLSGSVLLALWVSGRNVRGH